MTTDEKKQIMDCVTISVPEPQIGGQSVGRFDSTVIATLDAFGIVISIDMYRSRIKNKELALLLMELAIGGI